MTIKRMPGTACLILFAITTLHVAIVGSSWAATGCRAPSEIDAPIFSPPLAQIVVGVGRLHFYSKPSGSCPMQGIFIIPRDAVIAYSASDDGWTSVMFIREDGSHVQG